MERVVCKYHPLLAARWQCEDCQLSLCQECVGSTEKAPVCAICEQPMQRLNINNSTEPFWQCLSSFFMFPASFPTIMYLAAFAALSSLINLEVPGLIVGFFVYALFVNFSYTVLEFSARGEIQQLHTSTGGLSLKMENIIKLLVIFFMVVGINFLVYDMSGEGLFQVSAVLTILIFPVVVLQLLKHRNPLKMISATEMARTFSVMGNTYWYLCLAMIMLFYGARVSLEMIPPSPSEYMNLAITHFIVFYFFLVTVCMLGYGFYQFYDQLDLELEPEMMTAELVDGNGAESQVKQVNVLIQEGHLDKAGQGLLKVIETHPADLGAWQRYFRILLLQGDQEELNRFAQEYINYLLYQDKEMEAMDIYLDVQRVISDFRPRTGVQAFALANRLRAHGHAGLALNLLNNMHKHYRGYEGIAKAYMLAAQILCEQFGEDVKARKILNFIIKKYPQSKFAHEAIDYLKVVDRLAVR